MPYDKDLHLREYVKIVLKRKQIVLAVFILAMTVGLLISLRASPVFTASTRLKVDQKSGDPLGDIYSISRHGPEFFNSQIQIISSQSVMEKVVTLLNLTDTYQHYFPDRKKRPGVSGFFKKLFDQSEGNRDLQALTGQKAPVEKLAKELLHGLHIERIRDSNILKISFNSRNPAFSSLICNTLPRAYIEQLLEMKMTNTQYTIDWMEKKAAIERDKLEEAEHALQDYLVAQDIVTIEDRIAIIPEKLSQISSQLTSAEARQEELASIIEQIDQAPWNSLDAIPAIADEKSLQSIRDQIREAEQNMLNLSQKYGALHPMRIQAQKTIEELQAKKEVEIRNIVKRIRNDLQLAVTNQKNLKRQLEETKMEAARLNEKFIQYNILNREIQTKEQIYDALVARIKEQTMTKQIRDVDVYVVEAAKVPESAANQKLPQNLMIAAILGCLGGIGGALFLEYLDNTISFCEDAEEKIGIKALVAVPYIWDDDKKPETVVREHPGSVEAESYKVARTALSLSTSTGYPVSLMVTSCFPEEGKTLTCANLAIAVAQADRSVLLVDCDMRRPRLHKVLKKKSKKGFAEILAGQCHKQKVIQKTDMPNLDFIPAGTLPPNPSDLLSSIEAREIIQELTQDYDIVIFDTPPIGTVSDSFVLAGYVEKILLVTRSGQTRYEDVIHTINHLEDLAEKIVGLIVNAVDMQKQRYYYPYYRYSQYYTDE